MPAKFRVFTFWRSQPQMSTLKQPSCSSPSSLWMNLRWKQRIRHGHLNTRPVCWALSLPRFSKKSFKVWDHLDAFPCLLGLTLKTDVIKPVFPLAPRRGKTSCCCFFGWCWMLGWVSVSDCVSVSNCVDVCLCSRLISSGVCYLRTFPFHYIDFY